jgi:hypothetical protein
MLPLAISRRQAIKAKVLLGIVTLLAACSPPGPDIHIGKFSDIEVSTFAQAFAESTRKITIDWGPLARPGQLAIAQIIIYSHQDDAVNAPSGWTLIRDDRSPVLTRQLLYWHTVETGDLSAQTWRFLRRLDVQGAILLLDGRVAIDSPIDNSSGNSGGGSKPTAPSLNTNHEGDLILAFYATDFGPGGLGPKMPTNMSTILVRTLADKEYWILGMVQDRKAATSNITCETVQLSDWTAAQVAIRPRSK